LGLDPFDLALNVAAAIDDYFPVAVTAAQILVIDCLETFLADDVAGLVAIVAKLGLL
jgi:hypothetical protein